VTARLVAQKLTENLGKQFYVENQVGGGGNLGMGNAARAAPGGYTILLVTPSFVVNPSLFSKVPYDPKDFAPLTVAADAPNALFVHSSVPARTVPAASFARPLALSAVLPIEIAPYVVKLMVANVRNDRSFHTRNVAVPTRLPGAFPCPAESAEQPP
jgi:hypothetical protein